MTMEHAARLEDVAPPPLRNPTKVELEFSDRADMLVQSRHQLLADIENHIEERMERLQRCNPSVKESSI